MTYPLSLDQVSPGNGFKWAGSSIRPDGLPDGVHTDGGYFSPDEQEFYKPLDAKPCPNAEYRIPTDEDECLAAMRGVAGFLQEWHVEERNGRRWLVMPRLWFWPQESDVVLPPSMDELMTVENALREMNRRGWEYNDLPQLAFTEDRRPFLVDFSIAHHPDKWRNDWHSDEMNCNRWWALVNKTTSQLRQRGRHVYHAVQLPDLQAKDDPEPKRVMDVFYDVEEPERREHVHVYASRNRPMSAIWAKIPDAKFLDADRSQEPRVHTWVVSKEPLNDDTQYRYELTKAWSPWP